MKKWLYLLTAIMFAVGVIQVVKAADVTNGSGDSEAIKDSAITAGPTYSTGRNSVMFSSSGHLVPGQDQTSDLGSPTYKIRNLYIGTFNVDTETQSISSATTIAVNSSFVTLASTQNGLNLTGKPIFNTANARNGDLLTVMNVTTSTLFINSRTVLFDSGVHLAQYSNQIAFTTATLRQWDMIDFVYNSSTGAWIQRSGTFR